MQRPPSEDVVTVSVPPRPEFVHVLRAVTASVAARMRIPFDGIEDLRLAVDEACAWLLGARADAATLTLRLRPQEGRLEAAVSLDAAAQAWPPPGMEETFSWRVLSALVDSVSLNSEPTGPSIRLAKRTLEASRAT
jgi:serine/threonine-protein kinase RsbW